ncbi:hypothetical protein SCLCIDRAFT_25960 [Scleroderma citrinum Foug A]|uniref:Uncharacterized protein n=1 Tax=Scleroderma citrinum Foug A TaxID=1036808 RepID=A0A0C3DYN8_9AGAM|nr:hypothetical protein SCLCIDRAFT_25960 [Scleroderma citrinum Foug A]
MSVSSILAPRLLRCPRFHGFHVDHIALMHPRFDLDMATLKAWFVDLPATL